MGVGRGGNLSSRVGYQLKLLAAHGELLVVAHGQNEAVEGQN
jgi:hypothetical protein